MKTNLFIPCLFALTVHEVSSTPAFAKVDHLTKEQVQKAMKAYVDDVTSEDGLFPIIGPSGEVLLLSLKNSKKYPNGFHDGVKNHGKLHTSCADFIDLKSGDEIDIDFLVKKTADGYKVVQPIVHSINGKKNPYDLDHG